MYYKVNDVEPTVPESGNYWIAPGAYVMGNVTLKEDASVWFGSILRGDNDPIVIGQRSNIQDGTVIHTDIGCPCVVGDNVTVGHQAMLHGCTIGNNSLVGIKALVMNGAEIGEYCLIGAGAIVTEGKKIPDGSLVLGAPGKVIRELTDQERQMLDASAQVYVDNHRRFMQGFVPVTNK